MGYLTGPFNGRSNYLQPERKILSNCYSEALPMEEWDRSVHKHAGDYCVEVLSDLVYAPDHAAEFQDHVEAALKLAGCRVFREVKSIREYGDNRGRIDLLAYWRGGAVALELDNKTPRVKSMDKLRTFHAYRVVVLRGRRRWGAERDIDAVVSVPTTP